MKISRIYVFLIVLLVSPVSLASVEPNTTIGVLTVNPDNDVAILINNPSPEFTTNCPWTFIVFALASAEDRVVYSTLLAAKIANNPVTLYYSIDASNNCTLDQVNILNI